MSCNQYSDLIALAAIGEVSEQERGELEAHIQTCEACRAEWQALRGLVAEIEAAAAVDLSPAEQLELENRTLRALLDRQSRPRPRFRLSIPIRTTLRVAATLLMFALGYLTYPLVSSPEPKPVLPSAAALDVSQANIRAALNSGYRFSGAGLRLIAHGEKALAEQEFKQPTHP